MPAAPARTSAAVLGKGLRVLGIAIRTEPRIFAAAAVGSVIFGAMTVGQASVIGYLTTATVLPAFRSGHTTSAALVTAGLLVASVAVAKIVGIIGRRLLAGVMQYRMQARYRRLVTRQYLSLPYSWHQAHPTGELLSTANSDVEAAWFPIAPLPFAVGTLAMLAITLVVLVRTDWLLAVVGCVIFPLVAQLNVTYSRRMSPRMTRAQELRGAVSTIAHESFDGALVVKTLGREAEETARFAAQSESLRDALVAVGRVRGLFDPVMESLPTVGVLLVVLVGAQRVSSGHLSPGDLVKTAYLFTQLAFPIRAIGWVLGELPRSVVGWERIQRVLGAPGAQTTGTGVLDGQGPARVSAHGVGFAYLGPDGTLGPPVLRGVDLAVAAGATVAVVGVTGAGKSTLAGLLVRLVDPTDGAVRLDGTDVRDLAAGEVPRAVAFVPQQTFLFDDSIRGNITLGSVFDDAQIWAALDLAQAAGFVAALPAGLDTLVGERGASLSGGQRQRIALARALVRSPRLLVLDDATSSVDPSVEAAILAGLRRRQGGAGATTVVVVAYRQATIALADEVVLLDGGRVRARGSHSHLLASDAAYREILTAYDPDPAPVAG